jgi:DNA-binding SARP family transcriptional activator/streptogramin lyase
VEFRLLGPVEVRVEEGPLRLPGGKQRALLALLLLHANSPVSAERLIDGLWGEDVPPTAAASLQNQISRLRKILGAERVKTTPHGYVLRVEQGELDLHRFEALLERAREAEPAERVELLGQALALWRGRALEDVEDEVSARGEALRLEELRLVAVEERIDAELALGRHAAVLPGLEALVAAHPLRERVRAQHVLALYRAGRQVEALDEYRAFRRRLDEELGLEPSPAMRRLEQAILAHDESVALPGSFVPESALPLLARRPRRAALVSVLALAALIALVTALVVRGGAEPLVRPNSVALLDARSGEVVASVAVGAAPGAVAIGEGGVWVTSTADETLSKIDPRSRRVVDTIPLDFAPGALAAGEGAVWVADPTGGTVAKIEPGRREASKILYIGLGGPGAMPLATGWGSLWVGNENDLTLSRLVAPQGEVVSLLRDASATAIAVTRTEVWMLDSRNAQVWRIDPVTDTVADQTPVGRESWALAADERGVWITDLRDDAVWLLDPITGGLRKSIRVGQDPRAIAVAGDSVWVANSFDGTVSRIDRDTGAVDHIRVGERVGRSRARGRRGARADPASRPAPPAGRGRPRSARRPSPCRASRARGSCPSRPAPPATPSAAGPSRA